MYTEEDQNLNARIRHFSTGYANACNEITKDIVGQKDVVEGTLIAMIAGGNVLLEGVPGTGKTRLIRSISRTVDLPFARIQFTPDLMPADVTGTNIIEKDERGSSHQRFVPGPIFSSIVLADEINRATPKTQSALLEAMQEHRVTAGGETRILQEPFFVLATQNPVEQDGTYPLPEAQMDRFMFKLEMTFPSEAELCGIVQMTQQTQEEQAQAVLSGGDLMAMRATAGEIPVLDEVVQYAARLVSCTHPEYVHAPDSTRQNIRFGASPRAVQALITAARIRALINNRYNAAYEDIDALACPVLRHRIKLTYEAVMARKTPDMVIGELIHALHNGSADRSSMPRPIDRIARRRSWM